MADTTTAAESGWYEVGTGRQQLQPLKCLRSQLQLHYVLLAHCY